MDESARNVSTTATMFRSRRGIKQEGCYRSNCALPLSVCLKHTRWVTATVPPLPGNDMVLLHLSTMLRPGQQGNTDNDF